MGTVCDDATSWPGYCPPSSRWQLTRRAARARRLRLSGRRAMPSGFLLAQPPLNLVRRLKTPDSSDRLLLLLLFSQPQWRRSAEVFGNSTVLSTFSSSDPKLGRSPKEPLAPGRAPALRRVDVALAQPLTLPSPVQGGLNGLRAPCGGLGGAQPWPRGYPSFFSLSKRHIESALWRLATGFVMSAGPGSRLITKSPMGHVPP